jgi:FKBP-type peptidyl-prolyl cis-trans isomerase 2
MKAATADFIKRKDQYMSGIESRRVYRALMWFSLLFWVLAAVAAEGAETPEKAEAMKMLEKAMEQAKESGKPVTLDVGFEDPETVQAGDLVLVNYTASLEDGSLVYTTEAGIAGTGKKSDGFLKNESYGPEETVAGKPGFLAPVGGLVIGMKTGEKQTFTLPPEEIFGARDPKKISQFPTERRMPKKPVLDPQTYEGQFGKFPVLGKEVELTPYFKSRIVEVAENYVKLEALARGGERSEDPIGDIEVGIDGNEIVLHLTPRIGADFEMNNQKGKIVSTDGSTFTVDFNPPLAGKPVVIELEVVSLTKASAFKGMEIGWMEDHDKALEKAAAEQKPVVLMLYAPWCSWSKKLMNESMEDPRIKVMKDKFVWAKVNSETQKDIYQFYEQKGYPLTVLLSAEGEIIKKIDGYREAGALKKELEAALGMKVAKKK